MGKRIDKILQIDCILANDTGFSIKLDSIVTHRRNILYELHDVLILASYDLASDPTQGDGVLHFFVVQGKCFHVRKSDEGRCYRSTTFVAFSDCLKAFIMMT